MLEQITGFLLSLQAEVELDFISRNILTKKKLLCLFISQWVKIASGILSCSFHCFHVVQMYMNH